MPNMKKKTIAATFVGMMRHGKDRLSYLPRCTHNLMLSLGHDSVLVLLGGIGLASLLFRSFRAMRTRRSAFDVEVVPMEGRSRSGGGYGLTGTHSKAGDGVTVFR
jgi:hypothetical protein